MRELYLKKNEMLLEIQKYLTERSLEMPLVGPEFDPGVPETIARFGCVVGVAYQAG